MATKAECLADAASGQGCLGRSKDDEPVFVLVARDSTAPHAVREWAMTVAQHFGPCEKTVEAFRVAAAMDAWQAAHGSKRPD